MKSVVGPIRADWKVIGLQCVVADDRMMPCVDSRGIEFRTARGDAGTTPADQEDSGCRSWASRVELLPVFQFDHSPVPTARELLGNQPVSFFAPPGVRSRQIRSVRSTSSGMVGRCTGRPPK
jgi:hypothetical protein